MEICVHCEIKGVKHPNPVGLMYKSHRFCSKECEQEHLFAMQDETMSAILTDYNFSIAELTAQYEAAEDKEAFIDSFRATERSPTDDEEVV